MSHIDIQEAPAAHVYAFRNEIMVPPWSPPVAPADWLTGPPDFVGVGCQRCGTTRWWHYLIAHPQILSTERKELHFFDSLQGIEPSAQLSAAYSRYFPRPPGMLCGEWTPRYALDHWTPRLLEAAAPAAQVFVLVRDPVERFASGLALHESNGHRSHESVAAAVLRSSYGAQLRHLLRYVDRERVLVQQFESCVLDPLRELRRTYEALGVDPDFVPDDLDRRFNARRSGNDLTEPERRLLVEWLELDVSTFAADFPEIDLALWPNFSHLA